MGQPHFIRGVALAVVNIIFSYINFGLIQHVRTDDCEVVTIKIISDTRVVIDIARHAPLVHGLLQGAMHLASAERDIFGLLHDEVSQDGYRFPILAINRELAAARVLMHCDQRTSICFCHCVKLFLHDVDRGGSNGVRVPKIDDINHEFRVDVLKQRVPLVVFFHVCFHV